MGLGDGCSKDRGFQRLLLLIINGLVPESKITFVLSQVVSTLYIHVCTE